MRQNMDLFEAKAVQARVKELAEKFKAEGLSEYEAYLKVRQEVSPLEISRAATEIIKFRKGIGDV